MGLASVSANAASQICHLRMLQNVSQPLICQSHKTLLIIFEQFYRLPSRKIICPID